MVHETIINLHTFTELIALSGLLGMCMVKDLGGIIFFESTKSIKWRRVRLVLGVETMAIWVATKGRFALAAISTTKRVLSLTHSGTIWCGRRFYSAFEHTIAPVWRWISRIVGIEAAAMGITTV